MGKADHDPLRALHAWASNRNEVRDSPGGRTMPSQVGCAVERRTLRKQFDELVGFFIGFTAAHRLFVDVRIGVLCLLLAAIERCWEDLENTKRYWTYKNAVSNVSRTIDGF